MALYEQAHYMTCFLHIVTKNELRKVLSVNWDQTEEKE